MLAHSDRLDRRIKISRRDYGAEVQNTDCDWTARPVKGEQARCHKLAQDLVRLEEYAP
jgi:hypothetical protein